MVTIEEIERMLKDASKEYLKAKPSELKRLGIDEIAVIKGKGNYCAVLIHLEKSKLIGILAGRKQEEIREVLLGWGKEVLEQIEEVSIDLWKGYRNLVRDLMPNAQVVADRFHVMAQINKELGFFLTWYAKSIAKSVKEIEKICQNINQVLVRLDRQG